MLTAVLGEVYVGREGMQDDGMEPYWFIGPTRIEISAEDGQVRIAAMSDEFESEMLGIYLSPSSARDLVVGLGAAIRDMES